MHARRESGIAGVEQYVQFTADGVVGVAAPDGFHLHGRFEQPHRSKQKAWPHLVIAHGRMYVRDQDVLLCYDVRGQR